jgi:hypothetical protein
MNESERSLCAVLAARLEGQIQIGWLALVITAVSLLATALNVAPLWCGIALLGCAERYVAARLAIDARLFAQLASRAMTLVQLDEALGRLNMIKRDKANRFLKARIDGARAWANRHTLAVIAQMLLIALVTAMEYHQ